MSALQTIGRTNPEPSLIKHKEVSTIYDQTHKHRQSWSPLRRAAEPVAEPVDTDNHGALHECTPNHWSDKPRALYDQTQRGLHYL
jgi:hypothetical protein